MFTMWVAHFSNLSRTRNMKSFKYFSITLYIWIMVYKLPFTITYQLPKTINSNVSRFLLLHSNITLKSKVVENSQSTVNQTLQFRQTNTPTR